MIVSLSEYRDRHPELRYDEASKKWHEWFRDNAEVGDGVSVHYWSDSQAYTIIKRTPKSLTLQRAKATYSNGWKPEYIPGGFSAVCVNDGGQQWDIAPDPNGHIVKAYWSDRNSGFYVSKCLKVTGGYYEHYDHNF